MNRLCLVVLAVLMSGSLVSCKEQAQAPAEGSKVGFALSFFRNVDAVGPRGENVIVSPYSAGVVLSMLEAGAEGETKAEFDDALNGSFFKAESLGGGEGIAVKSANSAWINDDFSIRNHYVRMLEQDFGTFVDNVDFSSPSAVREINDWCSENTAGKIREIVDNLSPDMLMVLVNALYFNAPWEAAFNPEFTHDDVFHAAGVDVTVPMMFRKSYWRYAEYEGFQLIELPYAGGRYAMYIVLPPEGKGIDSYIPYLSEEVYDSAMKMLAREEVSLTMPKFKLSSSMLLNDALKKMGVRSAFSHAADFSEISLSGRLQLDVVKQKCYIDVSEEGTEAAAVTSAQIRMTAMMPETIMNVDRPFFFMIADRENENILFMGKIVNPE